MKSKKKNWKSMLVLGIITAIIGAALWSVSKPFSIIFMGLGILSIFTSSANKKAHKKELQEEAEKKEREEWARIYAEKQAAERAEKVKIFTEELNAIPRVSIDISEHPAKRRKEKSYPKLANITARTDIKKLFPLVVVDVETTGLKPAGNDIIEVSLIKYGSPFVPESCLTSLCKPRNQIPAEASNINHITDEMVDGSPQFAQIAASVSEYIKGCNIVGQNVEFDTDFLLACGVDLPDAKYFDTCQLARYAIKDMPNYKLDTLLRHYGIERDTAHRSLSDAYATALLFEKLVEEKRF